MDGARNGPGARILSAGTTVACHDLAGIFGADSTSCVNDEAGRFTVSPTSDSLN